MNITIQNEEVLTKFPPLACIREQGYVFLSADALSDWLGTSEAEWDDFSGYWNSLTLDRYMADGGTYRLRRYGAFTLKRPERIQPLPHEPYIQPRDINPLNGGVMRVFDPLEAGFQDHVFLRSLLHRIADVTDTLEGAIQRWNIKIHPYRILARSDIAGLPTPEGLHRDGVDYIAMMLVKRLNVTGGETTITDTNREPIWRGTLASPMDIIIANDHRTMHAVTPLAPGDAEVEAYRDVLIVAFTKE